MSPFTLAERPDLPALAHAFATTGHVRIPNLLAGDGADRLLAHLRGREDWRQIINSGERIFELDRATRAEMSAERAGALEQAVQAGARKGFQYRFESLRIPDEAAARAAASGDMPTALVTLMNSAQGLALLRAVIGHDGPLFMDGQATAYSPGDFLTRHDDNVAGKNRRAAYVFGLTPEWRPEWGGLLLFHGEDALRGMAPAFNVLDIFAVPQPHSVSLVTPAAPRRRYAITGWLRLQDAP